jgi:hypothetical protein
MSREKFILVGIGIGVVIWLLMLVLLATAWRIDIVIKVGQRTMVARADG